MLGSYFLFTAILSLTVDPWRINNTPLSIGALDASREISSTVRVGKAALANKGEWETVLFGSSRVEMAFDPSHPAFGGKKTVNLAMSAANILELVPAANYALDRNPDIRLILFGIDAGDLHDDFDSRKFTHFYESPFADNNISIERGINQLIGGRSLIDSIATVSRHFSGETPERAPLGQWLKPSHPQNFRLYVEDVVQMGFENPHKAWGVREQDLRVHKSNLLKGFLTRVRNEGIATHLFVPPQHALKLIHPDTNRPEKMCWDEDLHALASVCAEVNKLDAPGPPIRLWNFLTFNGYTTRALPGEGPGLMQMDSWNDLGHAQVDVGNAAIETMLAGENRSNAKNPVGVELRLADWDSLRADWIAQHEDYCVRQADDVEWFRNLIQRAIEEKVESREMVEEAN